MPTREFSAADVDELVGYVYPEDKGLATFRERILLNMQFYQEHPEATTKPKLPLLERVWDLPQPQLRALYKRVLPEFERQQAARMAQRDAELFEWDCEHIAQFDAEQCRELIKRATARLKKVQA